MKRIEYDVVIVDTGIYKDHPYLQSGEVYGISFMNGKIYDTFDDDIGHGTAIYSIIKNHNKHCKIFNIKAFGKNNQCFISEMELISVLNFIYERIKCKYINLSIGLCFVSQKKNLNAICQKLLSRGTIIVSAFDNSGCVSYPACLESVIGVTSHPLCTHLNDCIITNSKLVNVFANGNTQRILWRTPLYVFLSGNSFACAHITGLLSKSQERFFSNEDAVNSLSANSLGMIMTERRMERNEFSLDGINNVAIFPFNKETHSIIRFEKYLTFNITKVYDIKYSCLVGASTKKLLGVDDVEFRDHIIDNIDNIDWNLFDMLIVGHLSHGSRLNDGENFLKEIVKKAISNGKRVYSFDRIGISGERYFHPSINENMVENTFGMFYKIIKPIVGVFGTSSKQGKFSLQLLIRYKLIERGYSVGQLGTEPSSLLFGMDECIPFGYNNENELKGNQFVSCINQHIRRIAEKDVDIIISGCQSESLIRDFCNESALTIRQFEFLLGLQPDIIILSVNPFDDLHYIQRTISYLESVSDSEVLCLSLFPVDLKNRKLGIDSGKISLTQDSYEQLKSVYEGELGKPVFHMGNMDDIERMVDLIIDYFSK